jgi:endonuclease/exonuclease/phosphatase (EEP) superfamily protein YafD
MAMIRRIFAAAFLVVLALALLVFAWPQLFGMERTALVAQAVSLRGLAALVAIVGVVAFGLFAIGFKVARRFAASIALVLLVFSAINVAVLSTRGFGNLGFETANDHDVTVLSWNTLGNAPGAQTIANLAVEDKADVVVLPETSAETAKAIAVAMADAGMPMQVWTVAYDHVSKAKSTSLLISKALGTYRVDLGAKTTKVLPSVVATPVDGTGPTIVAVHAVSPIPGQLGNWQSDLAWLKGSCKTGNVIMAGDFNSTIDNYSGLSTAVGATIGACTDAGQQSHNAAVGSWPTALPALLGSPIDQVMFTQGWRVSGMRVIENVDKAGSDHRPILVQLSPKG